MTDDIHDGLEPEPDSFEGERLAGVGAELERARPIPGAAFRGALGRHLLNEGAAAARHRPPHLWVMVGGLAAAGLVLLGVAAMSIL